MAENNLDVLIDFLLPNVMFGVYHVIMMIYQT